MVKKVTAEKRSIIQGQISYGKEIAFIAKAPNPEAAEAFKTGMLRLGRGGYTNVQAVVDGNNVYVTGEALARKKTHVCMLIRNHAQNNNIIIPSWIRSHASFAKCHEARKQLKQKQQSSNKEVIEQVRATLNKSKENRRTKPVKAAPIVNNLPLVKTVRTPRKARKVSLFQKVIHWFTK